MNNMSKLPTIINSGDHVTFDQSGLEYSGIVKYVFQSHIVIDSKYAAAHLLSRELEYLNLQYQSSFIRKKT